MPASTSRPLDQLAIGISISGHKDLGKLGLQPDDVTTVTVELCQRLVALGASVVLGHQWRPRGIMESLVGFARTYFGEAKGPIIRNYLAWPDRAALSDSERKGLEKLVRITEGKETAGGRAGALRAMRELVAADSDARVCLGGKLEQPEGFVHGVIEEAALSLHQERPVYLARMMGGATEALIDYFGDPGAANRFEGKAGVKTKANLKKIAASYRSGRLAKLCGLEPRELQELFNAHNLDSVVEYVCLGLSRRRTRKI